jgi:hypothetical protein
MDNLEAIRQACLAGYARHFHKGLLSVPEVAASVLDLLVDSSDRPGLWATASKDFRDTVLEYLLEKGPDGLPRVFVIGEADPEWLQLQWYKRREVAEELLARG